MRGELPRNQILVGDACEQLASLPPASIDCVVTSPPYYGVRDYHMPGQIGLEPTVFEWVEALRAVCREMARVLSPTGSLWLNLGDSFSRHVRYGAPPKGLLLAPERLLLALAEDGWIVRTKVIWSKINAMPSGVQDRPTLSYEVVYFLVRQKSYFFDLDALREPYQASPARSPQTRPEPTGWTGPLAAPRGGLRRMHSAAHAHHPKGRPPRDVWHIATRGFRGEHYAVFPKELARRPIVATCPAVVCTACGAGRKSSAGTLPCDCKATARRGIVMDSFLGVGTTALVAQELGRDWLGIELNPTYAKIARQRLGLQPEAEDVEQTA